MLVQKREGEVPIEIFFYDRTARVSEKNSCLKDYCLEKHEV